MVGNSFINARITLLAATQRGMEMRLFQQGMRLQLVLAFFEQPTLLGALRRLLQPLPTTSGK